MVLASLERLLVLEEVGLLVRRSAMISKSSSLKVVWKSGLNLLRRLNPFHRTFGLAAADCVRGLSAAVAAVGSAAAAVAAATTRRNSARSMVL